MRDCIDRPLTVVLRCHENGADSPLRKEFARLHAMSAALNLIVLADGVALLLIGTGLRNVLNETICFKE